MNGDAFGGDANVGRESSDPDANHKRDSIYRQPLAHVGDFRFDAAVAEVFDDMIRRSVPGYGSIIAMLPTLAARFVSPGSTLYDLGCSLGTASFAVIDHVPADTLIVAVDQSRAMLDRFAEIWERRFARQSPPIQAPPVRLQRKHADILEVPLENAGLTLLNFTLQFIAPDQRDTLLARIAAATLPGGAVLVSEKIHVDDAGEQLLQTQLHHEFKRGHGYSDLEISQKRTALENTLRTETIQTHRRRLKRAGFDHVLVWFACLGFVSMIGVKSATAADRN
ncbi:MAG: carboxy-S-adenosyl-L-methionine synthase CmoA [Planctomycetota bacterium]